VDAVSPEFPCQSRVGEWNGDNLPVLLIFAATNSTGKWQVHHASINLHYEDSMFPRVKITEIKLLDAAKAQEP
jgi:hypothetical protein